MSTTAWVLVVVALWMTHSASFLLGLLWGGGRVRPRMQLDELEHASNGELPTAVDNGEVVLAFAGRPLRYLRAARSSRRDRRARAQRRAHRESGRHRVFDQAESAAVGRFVGGACGTV
jgi:hypothetical protein